MRSVYFMTSADAQEKYQIVAGSGHSFLPKNVIGSGKSELIHIHDKSYFVEFSKQLSRVRFPLQLGAHAKLNLASDCYGITNAPAYVRNSYHGAIFAPESVSLFLYLRSQLALVKGNKFSIHVHASAGPEFNFNGGAYSGEFLEQPTDQPATTRVYETSVQPQTMHIPYFRAQAGAEFRWRMNKNTAIGLSPFVSIASGNNDRTRFTVLPNDPANTSTGYFKRNRNEWGLKLVFTKW